jgi:UDP-N-acetylmuramate dehydrogenase
MMKGLREAVPLSALTTLGVGGAARFFISVNDEASIFDALAFAASRDLPVLILGGGSNVVISDDGFPGLVTHIAIEGIRMESAGVETIVSVASGEVWDSVVSKCVAFNLGGIETLSGIPGYAGATPIQNVGAYGQEVSQTIESVRVIDRQTMKTLTLSNVECGFGYRTSMFNSTTRDRYIVLEVVFRLRRNGEPLLTYRDLVSFFTETGQAPTLANVRAAVLKIRASKGMVIDNQDPDSRSVGSFFKNPIVADDVLQAIRKSSLAEVIAFPEPDGRHKISAAWLIERVGFNRGYTKGRAGISGKHTLAIVNRGGATAQEIVALAEEISNEVKERFGIQLAREPVLVGMEFKP